MNYLIGLTFLAGAVAIGAAVGPWGLLVVGAVAVAYFWKPRR